MKCTLCKQGETRRGETTITFQRGETTIIVKSVPAEICDNCGEYYLTQTITGTVLRMAEEAVARGAEVEILRFAA